jgi:hypothetical protein
MPARLKARLDRSAEALRTSVNQVIVDILDRKYKADGFTDASIVAGERKLSIRIESMSHPPGMPMRAFYLDDPVREREVAHYEFGLSSQFMWQTHIEQSDQYAQLEEIGVALIHYFNQLGRDIARLEWDQMPTVRNKRILQIQDAKTQSGEFILSLEAFLRTLKDGDWVDRYERVNGEASAMSNNWIVPNEENNSIQENTNMSAIALFPMGSGYSSVVLSGQPMSGAGVTGGRMFNNLRELQDWLKLLNVRPDSIPPEDFTDSRIVEIGEIPLEPPPQTREKVLTVIERAIKQAKKTHATVVFDVHDYIFRVTASSDAESEYGRYWQFMKSQ